MIRGSDSFRVAVVQACPVFLDRAATVDKASRLIAEAAAGGAGVAVFPECFVPGYPLWVWFVPAGETRLLRRLYAELLDSAVSVPDETTEALGAAAREAEIAVVIGVNERNTEASGTTLYNTALVFGPDGRLLARHRKLVPTAGERLVHGQGDGSTLEAVDLDVGRLGCLICWENYMPLARYALYAEGIRLLAAPTWDRGEPWTSTLRHIGKEGRVVVLGCASAVRVEDVPERHGLRERVARSVSGWVNPGGSAIVDPDGKLLAGPALEEETILFADIDRADIEGPRWQLDVAGHYGRPDVFELTVHRAPRPLRRFADAATEPPTDS